METKYLRHGDVLLTKVNEMPDGMKKLKHLTLALGEVTGHSHQITKGEAELFESSDGMVLVVNSESAALTHEEHAQIDVPEGTWEVQIQREYMPQSWRLVQD